MTGKKALPPEEKILPVLDALELFFGTPVRPQRDPVDVLIRGVLSQNTSDTNSKRAFDSLLSRFSSWDAVRIAPEKEVEKAILCGGLARQKTRIIQAALGWLKSRGGYSLEFLRTMTIEQAQKQLTSINGIGIKTARLVLLFGLDRPAFVVDTHVLRVCRRLALIENTCGRIRAHAIMSDLIPDHLTYSAHMNMIALGRQLCRPRNPLCTQCPVSDYCLH